MIIHQPEIIQKDGYSTLWARIETAKKRKNFPDYIWYRVPEYYGSSLSLQSDAFLASTLIAAMHFGENIEVRGAVSPRLAYSLVEYQFILHLRLSEYLKRVEIHYDKLQILDTKPGGVVTTFSGGVDSWFTIHSHLPKNHPIPEYQITHALFTHGFDIDLQNADKYRVLYSRYQEALKGIGLELVPMESNSRNTIIPRLSMNLFYGSTLVGYAMALGGLFKRFYIASSRDYYQLAMRASSSDPLADRLLSTETLDIVHNGAMYRRIEKIEAISNWETAQEHLRVCNVSNPGKKIINCSRCEKCTRTMVPLYALGKLDQFKTFSKPFKSNKDTLWLARKYDPRKNNYAPEAFLITKKYKPDLLPWIYLAAFLGTARYWLIHLLPGFAKKMLRRYGYFVGASENYDNPEIVSLIQSYSSSNKDATNDHSPA